MVGRVGVGDIGSSVIWRVVRNCGCLVRQVVVCFDGAVCLVYYFVGVRALYIIKHHRYK